MLAARAPIDHPTLTHPQRREGKPDPHQGWGWCKESARFHGNEAQGAAHCDDFPAVMAAEDVARTIMIALGQPPQVTTAQLVVVPTREA